MATLCVAEPPGRSVPGAVRGFSFFLAAFLVSTVLIASVERLAAHAAVPPECGIDTLDGNPEYDGLNLVGGAFVTGCDATRGKISYSTPGPDGPSMILFRVIHGSNEGAYIYTEGATGVERFVSGRFGGSGNQADVCVGPNWTAGVVYEIEYDLSTTWLFRVRNVESGVTTFGGCSVSPATGPVYIQGAQQEFGNPYRTDQFSFVDPYFISGPAGEQPPDDGSGGSVGEQLIAFAINGLKAAVNSLNSAIGALTSFIESLPGLIADALQAAFEFLFWDETLIADVLSWVSARMDVPPVSWLIEVKDFALAVVPTVNESQNAVCVPLPYGQVTFCPFSSLTDNSVVAAFIAVLSYGLAIGVYLGLLRTTVRSVRG